MLLDPDQVDPQGAYVTLYQIFAAKILHYEVHHIVHTGVVENQDQDDMASIQLNMFELVH
jgi:hypothetical protein